MSPVDPDVHTVVDTTNVSNLMHDVSVISGLVLSDAVAHQNAINAIKEASLAAETVKFSEPSVGATAVATDELNQIAAKGYNSLIMKSLLIIR